MPFRVDINALRAIAVMSVLLFHFDVPGFGGGFVGVDIFFVISGYLMTGIVFRQLEHGTFSFREFAERRARRIVPALWAMVGVCLILGWFWLLPTDYVALAQRSIYTSVFVSNFKFWLEAGYFTWSSKENPLLHTWTLGLEWQFYLALPVLAIGLFRLGRRWGLAIAVILAVTSLVYCGLYTPINPTFSFFLLPTRAWEFMFGGIGALASLRNPSYRMSPWFKLVGLILILFSAMRLNEQLPFPGFYALLPVVGSWLLIVTPATGLAERISALSPFQWLGTRSYSIYLWHWPVHVFAFYRVQREFSPLETVALIGVSLILGEVSFRLVEQPVRRRTFLAGGRLLITASLVAVALILGGSYGIVAGEGLGRHRLPETVLQYDRGRLDRNPERETCHFSPQNNDYNDRTVCRYPLPRPRSDTALWGDSFADAVQTAVMKAAAAENQNLAVFTYSACPPVLGMKRDWRNDRCLEFNRFALEKILNDPGIENVILAGNWEWYTEPALGMLIPTTPGQGLQALHEAFAGTVCRLTRAGKNVTILGAIPRVGRDTPSALAKAELHGLEADSFGRTLSDHVKRTHESKRLLQVAASRCAARVVDPAARLCAGGRCQVKQQGRSLYYDGDHLSGYGASLLIPELRRAMAVPRN